MIVVTGATGVLGSKVVAQLLAQGVPAPTSELEELKKDSASWAKVCSYIEANKSLGIEAIGKQLSRKYKMSPAVKKEIANLVNS